MRYIFFGTPKFAAIILEKLIEAGLPPVALVCNPDRPVGRKQVITPPPTKEIATKQGITILQPESIDDLKLGLQNLFEIRNSKFDFFLVAAYNKILPKEVIGMPRLGSVGVHPSLLPKFRGPSPIQSAILAGEKETGVTLYLLTEKMDDGPILAQRKTPLSSSANSYELADELAELGAELLIETLPKFVAEGSQSPAYRQAGLPQDESQATYTKKFTSDDAFVSEKDLTAATSGNSPEKAAEIDRKIRALNPEPGVFTLSLSKGGPRRVKLLEAKVEGNKLILKKTQEEGRNPTLLPD